MRNIDPIRLEVIKNRIRALTEEMGGALMRTAFSPNIKERRDFSCALFDGRGQMLGQAAHIPVHLGSMPLSVQAALERRDLSPGDALLLNDPFRGGTHLPDLTLVTPVWINEDAPSYFLANRAHHADIGGISAGSMPLSTEIFQEGLRIPPVKIIRAGRLDEELMSLILANVRTPQERRGDLRAQIAANALGETRMRELLEIFGAEELNFYGNALMDYAEKVQSQAIREIPDGLYEAQEFLEDDGCGQGPIRLHCRMEICGDRATVDLRGSDDQVPGCVNAVRAICLSAVSYCFHLLAPEDMPLNAGGMRPVTLLTRRGSVLDARFPAAVAGGNVETSQRVVDLVLKALAEALPGKIPAASCGSMNNLTIGGPDLKGEGLFAYYETIAGGAGGGPAGAGASGIQTHMTNTLNTPVEALEHAYPLRVHRYSLRQDSGGAGTHPGGEGLIRELEFLGRCRVTLLTERRQLAPYGLEGGQSGGLGRNSLFTAEEGWTSLPGKCSFEAEARQRIRIETPGGGGWGPGGRSSEGASS